MIQKGLAVAAILLFIGVAFTSSINANVSKQSTQFTQQVEDDDFTVFKTEFPGFRNKKSCEVKLTDEEALEVEYLFQKLSDTVDTALSPLEKSAEVYEIISELHDYGIFGDIEIDEVMRMYKKGLFSYQLSKFFNVKHDAVPIFDLDNYLCFCIGKLEHYSPRAIIFFCLPPFNIKLAGFVTIGYAGYFRPDPQYFYHPANGDVVTLGTRGDIAIYGSFYGQIRNIEPILGGGDIFYIGIVGFKGFVIVGLNDNDGYSYFFIGFARHIQVDSECPPNE